MSIQLKMLPLVYNILISVCLRPSLPRRAQLHDRACLLTPGSGHSIDAPASRLYTKTGLVHWQQAFFLIR